jgi:hypothetical protein
MPDGTALDGPRERSLSRRQALRRGAVLGTAAVWTTPLVHAVTISPASAQAPSPPPTTTTSSTTTTGPTTSTTEPIKEISNIQIVVGRDGGLYGLKWDIRWEAWSADAPDPNDCIRFFPDAALVVADRDVARQFETSVAVTIIDPYLWQIDLPLPGGYELLAGYSKAGNANDVGCASAVISDTAAMFPGVRG